MPHTDDVIGKLIRSVIETNALTGKQTLAACDLWAYSRLTRLLSWSRCVDVDPVHRIPGKSSCLLIVSLPLIPVLER